jgi:hypothetical protein
LTVDSCFNLRYSYFSWELRNTQIKITIHYQLSTPPRSGGHTAAAQGFFIRHGRAVFAGVFALAQPSEGPKKSARSAAAQPLYYAKPRDQDAARVKKYYSGKRF